MDDYETNEDQSPFKLLIAKGREQGFLTYHEVNDYLSDGIMDPEQLEDLINSINDMGIAVRESPPELASLISGASVEDEDEDVRTASTPVPSNELELGRTTDPVRMYMREMGSINLLTREGEIKIAKRIEDGIRTVRATLGRFPSSVPIVVDAFRRVQARECKLNEVLLGLESDTPPGPTTPGTAAQNREEKNKTRAAHAAAIQSSGEKLRMERLSCQLSKVQRLHKSYINSIQRKSLEHARTEKLAGQLSEAFMQLRMPPKFLDKLTNSAHGLRTTLEQVRKLECRIMQICVQQGGMPQKTFIRQFQGNETESQWYVQWFREHGDDIQEPALLQAEIARLQRKLTHLLRDRQFPDISRLKELGRRMAQGLVLFLPILGGRARGGRSGWCVAFQAQKDLVQLALPGLHPAEGVHHYRHRRREPAQGGAHRADAVLNALRDLDFALARQQVDAPHFAHVHAHRVGGAAQFQLVRWNRCAGGAYVFVFVFHGGARNQGRQFGRRLAHRDAHVVDRVDQILQLLRVHDAVRQVVVDFVVGEEALFPTFCDEQLERRLVFVGFVVVHSFPSGGRLGVRRSLDLLSAVLIAVGQERQEAGPLDRQGQPTLVPGLGSGQAAGHDFPHVRNHTAQ